MKKISFQSLLNYDTPGLCSIIEFSSDYSYEVVIYSKLILDKKGNKSPKIERQFSKFKSKNSINEIEIQKIKEKINNNSDFEKWKKSLDLNKKMKKSENIDIPPKKRTKGGQIVTYIIYVWNLFFLGSTIVTSFNASGTNSETKMFNGVLIFFVGLVIWSISYLILRLIRRSFGFITTEK